MYIYNIKFTILTILSIQVSDIRYMHNVVQPSSLLQMILEALYPLNNNSLSCHPHLYHSPPLETSILLSVLCIFLLWLPLKSRLV